MTLDLNRLQSEGRVGDHGDGAASVAKIAEARDALKQSGPPTMPMRVVPEDEDNSAPVLTFDESITAMVKAFEVLDSVMKTSLESHKSPVVPEEFDSDADGVRVELASNFKTTFGPRYPEGVYDRLAADVYAFFALKFALLPRTLGTVVLHDGGEQAVEGA